MAAEPDLEDLVLRPWRYAHLRLTLEDPALADAFELRDAFDRPLLLSVLRGTVTMGSDSMGLEGGTSGLVRAHEGARTLVLFSRGVEVLRRGVELTPERVTELRL